MSRPFAGPGWLRAASPSPADTPAQSKIWSWRSTTAWRASRLCSGSANMFLVTVFTEIITTGSRTGASETQSAGNWSSSSGSGSGSPE